MRISDWSSDVCSSDLLDARNIYQIVDSQPRARHIDPFDEKTNVRLKCWDISVRSNAADAIALRERPVRLNDVKRRHELRHCLHPECARIAERRSTQRRDGDRNILHRLFTLLRGDDDLIEHNRRASLLCMERDCRYTENCQHCRRIDYLFHDFPLPTCPLAIYRGR